MKILKIICDEGEVCHEEMKILAPLVVSILHIPNNHIVLFADDYNDDGSVKKSAALKSEIDKVDPDVIGMINQIIDKEWK